MKPLPVIGSGEWGPPLNEALEELQATVESVGGVEAARDSAVAAQAAAEAAAALATDISNINTTDTAMTAVANNPASSFAASQSASFASLVNVLGSGVKGGSDTSSALIDLLVSSAVGPGSVVYFPRSATPYKFSLRITVPDDVTLEFAEGAKVEYTGTAGFLLLGHRSRVRGLRITGLGQGTTESVCINLDNSKADQTLSDIYVTDWLGHAVLGVASIRPRLIQVSGTSRSPSRNFIRITTGNSDGFNGGSGHVIAPHIEDCHAVGGHGGIQLDGDWNDPGWRTLGFKVKNPTLIGCSGTGTDTGGIFVNGAVGGSAIGCWGDNNLDYGVGQEYCQDFHFIGCQGRGNATHGVSIQSNAENCHLISCTGIGNTVGGLNLNYSMLINRNGSTDTPGKNMKVIGCHAQGNAVADLILSGDIVNTRVSATTYATLIDGAKATVWDAVAENRGSGHWYAAAGSASTMAPTVGQILLVPQTLPGPKVTNVGVRVTSAGSAGAVLRLAIYADSGGMPGALLLDAGTVSATSVGDKTLGTPSFPSGPQRVWLAVIVQGAPSTAPTLASVGNLVVGLSSGTVTEATSPASGFGTYSSFTGAAPSTMAGVSVAPQTYVPNVAVSV